MVKTPIIRQTTVKRPVQTETEVRDAIVDSKSETRNIPLMIPGRQILREKVIQPVQRVVEEKTNIQRGESSTFTNDPVYRDLIQTQETQTKTFQAPAKQVFYQPIVEEQVINKKEELEFIRGQDKFLNLNTVQRNPLVREQYKTETVTVPGREIIRESEIQPVVNRERVELKISQGQDQEVTLDPLVQQPVQLEEFRKQIVSIPGKEVITQPILQEYFQKDDIHHFQNPVYQEVQF